MNLYQQLRGRQDSVEAFPETPLVPALPPGRERRRGREAPAAPPLVRGSRFSSCWSASHIRPIFVGDCNPPVNFD